MKTKLFYLLIPAISILFCLISAAREQDSESIFQSLKAKFGNISSISFKFESADNPVYKGDFDAKKSGMYKFSTPVRIIVCNGKIINNYSVKDNQLIISEYNPSAAGGLAFETLFFKAFNELKPISFTKETSSSEAGKYVLKLEPGTSGNFGIYAREISIITDKEGSSIFGIVIDDGVNKNSWKISAMKLNHKLEDSMFEFKPPQNCEIIDLR